MAHWFYIPPSDINLKENLAILSGDEWVHASKVLRYKVGDKIEFFDGQGSVYSAKIISSEAKTYGLQILKTTQAQSLDYSLGVYIGLPKGRKIDFIVKALTEIGVSVIGTFSSKYAVAKAVADKGQRLQKIAVEACKQSKRALIPKIKNAISFEELLKVAETVEKTIVFYENASSYQSLDSIKSKKIAVIIGPEGGFAEEEIDLLSKKGAVLSRLSDGILRVETAAIAAAQLARYSQLS